MAGNFSKGAGGRAQSANDGRAVRRVVRAEYPGGAVHLGRAAWGGADECGEIEKQLPQPMESEGL